MTRLLLWSGIGSWRAEASQVTLAADRLSATGTQMGVDPLPYRLDYHLETRARWVTSRLVVVSCGDGWRRHLDLRRAGEGAWTCTVKKDGDVDLPPAGGDLAAVAGALDCDLGRSPLTNVMPVLRHDLHCRPGAVDFLMVSVSVPDLAVYPSHQRYEHVKADDQGAVVRYVGAHRGFVGELELDRNGFVRVYPELARREPASDSRASA
jgi:hypothetical protein